MSKIEVNTIDVQSGSTLTLGSSGKTVTLAACASQSGFGRTGTVNWCTTAKTSPLTAVSGKGYFINTSGGAVTVTLPSSPSAGDIVSIKDYASTFSSNNVTVGRGGSKMGSECLDATLSTDGDSITLVYVDGTQGWLNIQTDDTVQGARYVAATGGTITTCGNFKVHTFTGDGCFQVTNAGNAAGSNTVDYLVVAGGGGTSSGGGGGGGAGGYRESDGTSSGGYSVSPLGGCVSGLAVPVQTYPITVGGGGAGGSPYPGLYQGANGSNSIFSTITSAGGGRGGQSYPASSPNFPNNIGIAGGSGGGGGYACTGNPSPSSTTNPNTQGGAGNTPPVSPPQGNPGGAGQTGFYGNHGGGGGATSAGGTASGPSPSPGGAGGNGGNGATSEITFSPVTRGGGGGGPAYTGATAGTAGPGGGGAGRNSTGVGTAGTANTGGGAGGSISALGAAGGSGVVIIRYKFQ